MECVSMKELSDFKLAVKDAQAAKAAADYTGRIADLARQAILLKYGIKDGDGIDMETGTINRKPAEKKEPSENVVPIKQE